MSRRRSQRTARRRNWRSKAKVCSTTQRSFPTPLIARVLGFEMIASVPRSRRARRNAWLLAVEQVQGAAVVGHVRAGGEHVDRGAAAVVDQVMVAAGLTSIDQRWACPGTPFFASM